MYEPPWPAVVSNKLLARLEELAAARNWDELALTFFRDALFVPVQELEALRATDFWPPTLDDARASLGDGRALNRYDFNAERSRGLDIPVRLQTGSESPPVLYVTDAFAAALPNARIAVLSGQAHEGMTTAPEMYAEAVAELG